MIYLVLILILLATIEFNKQLIDNVKANPKEQKEWHYAQLALWVIMYGSIMFLTQAYLEVITFACFYPHLYDIGLNIRRGFKWNHKSEYDLSMVVKNILAVIGIISIIIQTIWS